VFFCRYEYVEEKTKGTLFMNNSSKISYLVAGVLIGVIMMLSCGDDSPTSADAATCDCPSAEPPLTGRVVEVMNTITLPPVTDPLDNGRGSEGVNCPTDAIVITGGCTAEVGQVPDIVLQQSFPEGRGWNCSWKNLSNQPVVVRVIARCLQPAQ
jgi:hypothetical protein